MRRISKETRKDNQRFTSSEDVDLSASKNAGLIEDRHQQIVAGACKVFFEKGFHPTTTRDLAAACGMSMGQLYHYISSKDDVLYLVHKHYIMLWRDYLRNSMVESIADPKEKLAAALRNSLDFIFKNRRLSQFIFTESKHLERKHLRTVLNLDNENIVKYWRDLLEEVNRQTPIEGDLELLANQIVFIQVFEPLRGWTVKNRLPEESRDAMIKFILRGLGLL
jgi:AcrR family transcriptional regulator